MISLIPSLQLPRVSVAARDGPGAIGVHTMEIVVHTMVSILVYHASVVPVMLGCENLAPVDVCSSVQNGSVPRATNGVSRVMTGVGGVTVPVATITGGVTGVDGARGVDWNRFVHPPSERSARVMMEI
jgi:hypothetical protein